MLEFLLGYFLGSSKRTKTERPRYFREPKTREPTKEENRAGAINCAHGIEFTLSYGYHVLQHTSICHNSRIYWHLLHRQKSYYSMTKQAFDLIMFTTFFGSILLAIYTNNLPESDHKEVRDIAKQLLKRGSC